MVGSPHLGRQASWESQDSLVIYLFSILRRVGMGYGKGSTMSSW